VCREVTADIHHVIELRIVVSLYVCDLQGLDIRGTLLTNPNLVGIPMNRNSSLWIKNEIKLFETQYAL